MQPRCLRVSDGVQCGGRDFTTGGAGERDGMGAAELAVTQRGGCSTDSPTGGAIDSGADRVASGRCAGSCGGGDELVQSRASAERGQRRSSECWSAERNRKLGTSSVEDSRQRSRLGGDRCGRRCAQHVAERQLRLLRPALLLLALLSCGHSPLSPPAGPLAPARDAPARTRRSALFVGATRAYFPFFPSFAQSVPRYSSSPPSALPNTLSHSPRPPLLSLQLSSAAPDKSSSSNDTSSSGSDKPSSSNDTSSSGSDKSSSHNDTSSSGSDKSSSSGDTSSSGSDKSSSSGDTSSSGSDKSSSHNDTSSSGSDKSSSSGDTSSSGSDKSSSHNDTSSSGSDKSSSSGDTSSSGSDNSSSGSDTSSSGSDTSSSGSDTSSNSSEPSTDSSGGGSDTGGGGQSAEGWRAPWAKGGVAEAETVHLVLTRGARAAQAEPTPAADAAVVAAGLPELPRVGLKNEIRYEYGDARDSALLRTTMYTAVGASRDPAVSAEFRAAVSRADVTIAPPRSSADRYHTEVRVGSSQQAFSVMVDTASDLLWLPCDCVRCTDGPSSSATPTPFKPAESTTLTTMPCDASSCSAWADDRSLSLGCSIAPDLPTPDSTCQYSLVSSSPQGSSAGNLVRDEVHLSLEDGSFLAPNLTFGCGRYQTGVLATDNGAPGGVLGLGTGALSPLSQLADSGVVPRAGFALCLEGDDAAAAGGGSHLLLGTTDAGPASGSTRVYKSSLSPLFYVKIKDMHLGTADLVVTPAMFPPLSSAGAGGTALDSSSAASVLPRPAYMALATAFLVQYPLMKFASSESAQEGLDCLDATDYHQASMTPAEFLQQFPPLTLVLAGGKGSADFTIAPTNYLKIVPSSPHVVCFTVRMASSQAERAVIGDPWMRDKYLVIDTHKDTLSWIDANCTTGLAIIRNTTDSTTNTTSSTLPPPSPGPAAQPQPSPNSSSTTPPSGSTSPPQGFPPSILDSSPGPTAAPPSIAPPSLSPPSLPPPSPPPPPPPPPPSPPPPNNPPPNPPPPPNNPPLNPPPPPANPPPANPPPPPSPPIEPPIAGCQPSPTDCAFFFAGHEGQVPTFSIQPRQGDAVLSTSELKTSIMGSDIQVLAGNSGEAQIVIHAQPAKNPFFLASSPHSVLTSSFYAHRLIRFPFPQQDVQQRTFNRIENLFALRNAYVKLQVTAAEMDVFGMTVNMNPGDGNSYFPEDKRCVLFKTKLPDG
ncbi:unnamed protein product [Closterium sp. Naga37s-1]|nr:unnamed protein product [Closterium sp. Naga37s-1]